MNDDDRWPEPDIARLVERGFTPAQAWEIVKRQAEIDEARQQAENDARLEREYPGHYPESII